MPQVNYYLTLVSSGQSNPSGYITAAEIASSGFATYTALHASGYVRNYDLLASGYVRSVNGLSNQITLVGSGGTLIWTDGSTIQVYSSGGGAGAGNITDINGSTGPSILLREVIGSGIEILTSGTSIFFGLKPIDLNSSGFATYSQLHTSGYVRNTDLLGSGFITKAEVASSGFLTRTELQSSGYTTLTEVRNDIRTSGYELHSDILASGYLRRQDLIGSGYISALNGLKNSVTLIGSGNTNIWVDGQTIQVNTLIDLTQSGFATYSNLHASGYIRNIDFVQSGFITKAEVASSGFLTRTELQTSGYTTLGEVRNDVTSSGYVKHTDMLTSGYLRHQDLLTSGYVRSINSLKNTPNIVGSGLTHVWVDGQTIQINAETDLSGSGFATYSSLHSSGYIRNADFVQSGFITKAEVASSGFATISQLVTSGYTTLAEVRNDIRTSGYELHSDILTSGYLRRSDLLGSGYVSSLNGIKWNINIVGSGASPRIWVDGQTIQISDAPIDLVTSGFATYSSLHTSGYIRNVDFVQSGFITKAEVASSGFLTRTELQTSGYTTLSEVRNDVRASGYVKHSDMLVSGYLRHQDLLTSGYVRSVNGLKNTLDIVGSGSTHVWIDGQTVQINSFPDLSSSGFATYSSLHASGYIRNVDFIQSGFITKAEVASSGFLTRTELQTSGYTTLTEVRNDIRTSGYVQHADMLVSGYLRRADLIGSGYVQSINGLQNNPIIVGSGNIQVWVDGTNIEIGTTATTLAQVQSDLHSSGYIRNVNFVQSGFITKAEVASSGFLTRTELQVSGYTTLTEVRNDITSSGYERHSDMLVSGYLRRQDLIGSGYVSSINGLKNAITLVGSGSTVLWVDGQTIQITNTPGAQAYYPVDARAVSGHILPDTTNTYNIGASGNTFKESYTTKVRANNIYSEYGRELYAEEKFEWFRPGRISQSAYAKLGESGIGGPKFIRRDCEISEIIMYVGYQHGLPGSGVQISISSGAPNHEPINMYVNNPRPATASATAGWNMIVTGYLPDNTTIKANTLLYLNIDSPGNVNVIANSGLHVTVITKPLVNS